jgi:hypothetical protein
MQRTAGRFRELGYFWEKSQNHAIREKRDAGRGGSAGGEIINTATRPKSNGFHYSGSAILELLLVSVFAGRVGADRVGFAGTGLFCPPLYIWICVTWG